MDKFKTTIQLQLIAIIVITFLSCNQRFFVPASSVVLKHKGLLVFLDRDSVLYADRNGDVFTDSLAPDFFLPYSFRNKAVSLADLETAFNQNQHKASFIHLARDCNDSDRNSSIKLEARQFLLDRPFDSYSRSSKLHILPVEIHFLKSRLNEEYYDLSPQRIISYKGHDITLKFQTGYLDVLQADVLEPEWIK